MKTNLRKKAAILFAVGAMFSMQSVMAKKVTVSYPAIYPFVPAETNEIYGDVKRVTEDRNFLKNFYEITQKGYSKARTKEKPWTASYWPLSKGTIADPFEESSIPYYVDWSWVDWEQNYDEFKKRYKKKLKDWDKLSEEELAKLAPSEKYDILIGDSTFDLTKRLWEYMKKWGSKKEHAFITDMHLVGEDTLDTAYDYVSKFSNYNNVTDVFNNAWNLKDTLSAQISKKLVDEGKYSDVSGAFDEALSMAKAEAGNYVLEKKNSRIAAWEGICNGWSTAAGLVPRPRKVISFELPNGKNLKFYPSDIKGLVSLYYVNSLIQDNAYIGNDGMPTTQGTVSAGLRCNLKNAKKDIWGRKYDHVDDPFNGKNFKTGKRDPRCVGVHPATWHLGLVNLIGKQGRSFVVERKVGAAVDNHPMYKYDMEYFNPNTGKTKDSLEDNVVKIDENDQFRQFRNKKAKYIVGVTTTMTYLNYSKPTRKKKNSEKDDETVDKRMHYDLELDAKYNIVGGQWRAVKVGYPNESSSSTSARNRATHNQPDFFWAVTKNYKSTGWFDDETDIDLWVDKAKAPPSTWVSKAHQYHSFEYKMNINTFLPTCRMKDKRTGKFRSVYCSQSYNRPQPLINVVNALVEKAK